MIAGKILLKEGVEVERCKLIESRPSAFEEKPGNRAPPSAIGKFWSDVFRDENYFEVELMPSRHKKRIDWKHPFPMFVVATLMQDIPPA